MYRYLKIRVSTYLSSYLVKLGLMFTSPIRHIQKHLTIFSTNKKPTPETYSLYLVGMLARCSSENFVFPSETINHNALLGYGDAKPTSAVFWLRYWYRLSLSIV